MVDSSLSENYAINLHAPLISFDSIAEIDWVWKPIQEKKLRLTEEDLEKYIILMYGSFAKIFIHNGPHRGYHLMFIKK